MNSYFLLRRRSTNADADADASADDSKALEAIFCGHQEEEDLEEEEEDELPFSSDPVFASIKKSSFDRKDITREIKIFFFRRIFFSPLEEILIEIFLL